MKRIKLFEAFVGGVNYDSVAEVTLKKEVGDLSKITPYILEYGNKVISDGETFDIYEDDKLVKKGIPMDLFLTKYCQRPITKK